MQVGFFLKEASRSLQRNAVPSFAAVASVLVTMLVLGVFIPVLSLYAALRLANCRLMFLRSADLFARRAT